jgi:hypothetical protein
MVALFIARIPIVNHAMTNEKAFSKEKLPFQVNLKCKVVQPAP